MKREGDKERFYESVDKNFYHDQTESRNPLRKWFHLNRYRIGRSLVKAHYESGTKVVDLGCGSCDWNTGNLEVFGIDLNENLLKAGKENGRLIDFNIAEASSTGFPSEYFDIVTSFEFLEHTYEFEKVIVEAMRLLKAGGHCIISVPFDVPPSLWRPLFFIQVVFQGYLLGNPYYRGRCGHVNSFSVESITKAFQRRGFIVESAFVMRKLTIFLSARKPGTIGAFSRSWEDVTVILPTLNEEKNISGIINRLVADYPGCEIIVSDDGSTDKTKERVSDLPHSKITFLDRSKKDVHGLTVSVLDAVDLVKTKYFIVMDADGQHPSEKVGDMVNILRCGASLVVASRVEVEQGWGVLRRLISYCGTLLGKTVLIGRSKNFLTFDVLGGFFGCNTLFWQDSIPESVKRTRFRLKGYKVLFDFLKYAPASVDIEEVYYRFETRKAEISKINPKVYWEYLMSCLTP